MLKLFKTLQFFQIHKFLTFSFCFFFRCLITNSFLSRIFTSTFTFKFKISKSCPAFKYWTEGTWKPLLSRNKHSKYVSSFEGLVRAEWWSILYTVTLFMRNNLALGFPNSVGNSNRLQGIGKELNTYTDMHMQERANVHPLYRMAFRDTAR